MAKRFGSWVALALALALALPTRASAAPVGAGIWYEFCFGAAGTFAFGIPGPGGCPGGGFAAPAPPPPPWTYFSAAGGTLTIVDGYLAGDVFAPVGTIGGPPTSAPFGPACGPDPVVCMGFPGMSKGIYGFGAGFQVFDILVVASPFGAGAAFFRIDEAGGAVVPEPATFALLATGLLGLGVVARRRRA